MSLKAENSLDYPSIEYSPFFRRGASGVASSEMVVSQEFDFPTLYAARGKSGKLQRNVLDKGLDSSRRDILLNAKLTCLELIYLDRQKEILAEREAVAVELQKPFRQAVRRRRGQHSRNQQSENREYGSACSRG